MPPEGSVRFSQRLTCRAQHLLSSRMDDRRPARLGRSPRKVRNAICVKAGRRDGIQQGDFLAAALPPDSPSGTMDLQVCQLSYAGVDRKGSGTLSEDVRRSGLFKNRWSCHRPSAGTSRAAAPAPPGAGHGAWAQAWAPLGGQLGTSIPNCRAYSELSRGQPNSIASPATMRPMGAPLRR